MTLALEQPAARRVLVRDCRGRVVSDGRRELSAGAHRLAVPPAGLIELEEAP